jgi:hypothetical protein
MGCRHGVRLATLRRRAATGLGKPRRPLPRLSCGGKSSTGGCASTHARRSPVGVASRRARSGDCQPPSLEASGVWLAGYDVELTLGANRAINDDLFRLLFLVVTTCACQPKPPSLTQRHSWQRSTRATYTRQDVGLGLDKSRAHRERIAPQVARRLRQRWQGNAALG